MASAAIHRSAARSLRPQRRQSLDLLTRRLAEEPTPRLFSTSAHSERHKRLPSSEARSKEHNGQSTETKEAVYERLSMKADKILDGIEKQTRLLQELKIKIEGDSKLTEKPSSSRKSSVWSTMVVQKWRSWWKG